MWGSSPVRFHVGSWLLWLAAAMLAALSTRNPYYLTIVLAVSWGVSTWLERGGRLRVRGIAEGDELGAADPAKRGRNLLLGAVVSVTVIVALLKGLSLHLGTTVLFTLPEEWPVFGGPITLEAMVSSSLDALSILTVLAVFAAFSSGSDYYALLRSVPPFLHQVGLVTSIAITFVPQTVTRFTEIREAQALRGHRVRRIGDLLPLIMPLLAGGMERSMDLAEAMEARGFSRGPATSRPARPAVVQSGLAAGLGLVLAGSAWPAFVPALGYTGWAAALAGLGLLAFTLRAAGAGARRTHYRRGVWRERDTLLAAASVGLIGFLLTYRILLPASLIYYPFPSIYPPPFDPVIGLALLSLGAPVVSGLSGTGDG
ncbi:MAG: energy-coupling factor transporter transmembrane component T [Chloroflexia bacterium]